MSQSVLTTIRTIGDGSLVDSAEKKLQTLVQAVKETGKQGSLTITITVKKATKGGAMIISGDPKLKLPNIEHHEALMFPTDENNLVTENPKQKKLDLEIIDIHKDENHNGTGE